MRLLLAQLAPRKGDPSKNLERMRRLVRSTPGTLAVFPELYLTGYRVGDHVHRLALRAGNEASRRLSEIAQEARSSLDSATSIRASREHRCSRGSKNIVPNISRA